MAKIKWKDKKEIDAENQKPEENRKNKERFKGKVLTAKERNKLIEQIAKDLGYL